jgi:predicted acylesterase/phospholipase RssA
MIGSSAGALLSILAACQVDVTRAVTLAHELCVRYKVLQRPLGLAGVWGGLVREWLRELLPADAAEKCNGRVTVVVTQLPWLTTHTITTFKVGFRVLPTG